MFVAVGRGHEDRDVLPDDLRGGVAEDPLGGRVERLDGPLLVDGDDAIHGGVDDRPDPVPALEQLLLHPLQRGDVGERDHHPLDPVLLGAVRQHLADVPQVLVVADLSGSRHERFEDRLGIGHQVRVGELLHQIAERPADVRGDQVEQLGRSGREPLDAEPAVEEDRRDVGAGQQVLQVVGDRRRARRTWPGAGC